MVIFSKDGEKIVVDAAQPQDADPYAVLRAKLPVLRNMTKDNFPNYTSLLAAYGRAIETHKEKPLLNDMYAEALAGEAGKAFVEYFKKSGDDPETAAFLVLRHLVIDEEINESLSPEIRQVVVVGSGMDSRSYRLQGLADCHVFELDSCKDLAEHKQRVLKSMNAKLIPKKHDVIITNLAETKWPEELVAHGFEPSKPTLWIIEAVLEYLDEASIDRLLTTIDRVAAPKSQALIEMYGTGPINMGVVMHDNEVAWNIDTLASKQEGGVLRAFPWKKEMLIERDANGVFTGRRWDPVRFARFNEPIKIMMGGWYVASCIKEETK